VRITFLSHFPGRGGSTTFLLQLRSFFESMGHSTSVVVGADSRDALLPDRIVVPRPRAENWRGRMELYKEVAERTKPDLVYAISGTEEFDVLRFLSCARVVHFFSLEQHEYLNILHCLRQLGPFNEARTANTPDVLDELRSNGSFHSLRLLAPYRISKEFFSAPEANSLRDSRRGDAIDICFVGRLEAFQKRAHWLPQIISSCAQSGRRFAWHIYGDGPVGESLREAMRNNREVANVQFHGWLEAGALARRLPMHDLLFMCSRWEGLPIAMVEAMLCGQACVVPAIPAGMTYLLSRGGGWLYEATSPQACAAALIAATADRNLLQQRRQEAQRIARELFAMEKTERDLNALENALRRLQFNGRVLSINRARKFRNVPLRVAVRRRILNLTRALRLRRDLL